MPTLPADFLAVLQRGDALRQGLLDHLVNRLDWRREDALALVRREVVAAACNQFQSWKEAARELGQPLARIIRNCLAVADEQQLLLFRPALQAAASQ